MKKSKCTNFLISFYNAASNVKIHSCWIHILTFIVESTYPMDIVLCEWIWNAFQQVNFSSQPKSCDEVIVTTFWEFIWFVFGHNNPDWWVRTWLIRPDVKKGVLNPDWKHFLFVFLKTRCWCDKNFDHDKIKILPLFSNNCHRKLVL